MCALNREQCLKDLFVSYLYLTLLFFYESLWITEADFLRSILIFLKQSINSHPSIIANLHILSELQNQVTSNNLWIASLLWSNR